MSDRMKYSGWAPKHLLDALDQQEKPAEDKPKRGRRPKVQEDVSE